MAALTAIQNGGFLARLVRDDLPGLSVRMPDFAFRATTSVSNRARMHGCDHPSTINRRVCDVNILARRAGTRMKPSTASRCAFAILIALLPLPPCGFVLNGSPKVVFGIGATAFFIGVLLLVWLLATGSIPLAGPPPVAKRIRFTIRDLLCLTTVVFGMTMFIVSGFKCEAAERSSLPGSLPAVVFRQFVWELESGLVCTTIGGLIWIRSALNAAMSGKRKSE